MSDTCSPGSQGDKSSHVVYEATYDPAGDVELGTEILLALDSIRGCDVDHGDPLVFEAIDLDALNELFKPVAGSNRNGSVTFTVDEYAVTATAAGEIRITDRPTQP